MARLESEVARLRVDAHTGAAQESDLSDAEKQLDDAREALARTERNAAPVQR